MTRNQTTSSTLHKLRVSLMAAALGVASIVPLAFATQAHDHSPAEMAGRSGHYAALTDEHLRRLIHHLMERVDEPQRGQMLEIAKAAHPEFDAFEQRARQARAPRREILLADVIDAAALDSVRIAEMRVAEERSRRVDQLLVDVANVMTPQQRAQFLEELRAPGH